MGLALPLVGFVTRFVAVLGFKYELYDSFKAINDKWISGNDFKNKTLFEDVLLMDRANRNSGDKVLVDVNKLKFRLTDINPKTSMLTFVQTILVENNFVVMNIPSYVNFYNVQDAVKNPVPKPAATKPAPKPVFPIQSTPRSTGLRRVSSRSEFRESGRLTSDEFSGAWTSWSSRRRPSCKWGRRTVSRLYQRSK